MQRTCELCGAQFSAPPSVVAAGRGKFCSRACQGKHKTRTATGPDRAKLLERKRRYRERHLEDEQARNRQWRAANTDYLREQNRIWRESHREEARANARRFRQNNPEAHSAAHRAAACNTRARKAGAPGRITRADITALWERQPACQRCRSGRGVDHIVSFRDGGTNTPDNLQNLCKDCNALKEARLTREEAGEIRRRYAAGERDRKVLAKAFGVSPSHVWSIVRGEAWLGA